MERLIKHLATAIGILATALCTMVSCSKEEKPEQTTIPEEAVFIKSVYVNGNSAEYDPASMTFTVTVPTSTDFGQTRISYSYSASEIYADGVLLPQSGATLDLSRPVKLTITCLNVTKDYTLVARNTGLPVVRITTPGGRDITSKTIWMEGADIKIELPDGTVDLEGKMSIRGRGNSTWNYPKKPYAIKLDEKSEVLGMPKHKRWVLLANWKDRTLLRNDAAFWLSKHTGLDYTVKGQFVELELNGTHKGNYYLCEQIKIDKNRVNVGKGGVLMELDTYYDEVNKFHSPYFNLPWQFKEPDEDELTQEQFAEFKKFVTELEALLMDEKRVRNHEYEKYLDVDSAIDFMFVNELATNTDFYSSWPSAGPHSCYMYKDKGGALMTGPVWDFDYHGFLPGLANQWAGATKTLYYKALYKDEKFRNRMYEKWEEEKPVLQKLPDYIDEMAEKIRLSEAINHNMWPIVNNPENGDETMSHADAVERIKEGFTKKLDWMDKHLRDLR